MGGCVTTDIWHVISGDWVPLVRDRLALCQAAIRNHLPSISTHIDAEPVVAHSLILPFYEQDIGGTERRMELCQIDLPTLKCNGRWLRRWLLVLWDGADEALPVTGTADSIHRLNERIGLAFGVEGTPEHASRLQFYARFFCAVIVGDQGSFVVIERTADLGWDPTNLDLSRVDETSRDPAIPRTDPTFAPLTFALTATADPTTRTFRSPAIESVNSATMCYGGTLYRMQIAAHLSDPDGRGRWKSCEIQMLEDGPSILGRKLSPLFTKTWPHAGFVSLAASSSVSDEVSLAAEEFVALLPNPRLRAATQEGRFTLVSDNDASSSDRIDQALWSVVLRYWGVPAKSPIHVHGDVTLRADAGPGVGKLELDFPVVIRGNLSFQPGMEFGYPIRLERWSVLGRLCAKGVRFGAQVELINFILQNQIPERLFGTSDDSRPTYTKELDRYPEVAVELDEVHLGAGLVLQGLTASGALSICRGRIDGDLLFDEVSLVREWIDGDGVFVKKKSERPKLALDRSILNAERLSVAGSARIRLLSAEGSVVLDGIQVGGTLGLWNTLIHRIDQEPSGLRIDRAIVGGDLLIGVEDATMPSIIAGDGSMASTEVGGNLGLTLTYVRGSLHLDHVKVEQSIFFEGVLVEEHISMQGLKADAIRVTSDVIGVGLIVRGQDAFGRSIMLFGASIGSLDIEGIHLAGSFWIVGLTVGPRFRILGGRYDAKPAILDQASRALRRKPGATWRDLHGHATADEPRREPAVVPHSMSSFLMYESRCGGNVELWDLTLDSSATSVPARPLDRAFHLRNTSVEGNLSLHDPKPSVAVGPEAVRTSGRMIVGNVVVEGGLVRGRADFSAVRVTGNLELRGTELHGDLQTVDAQVIATGTSGGCLSVVNVRSAADLLLSGTCARICEVRGSRIEGDLEVSFRTIRHSPATLAQFTSFEAIGNVINGRVVLQHLHVSESIDLTDTRAVLGLTIGPES